jgi:DNA-binding PucR family transcriptional regulator
MRIDPAAERLFVHPNTVRYRLRRYEEETGVDLRETEDAFRVWWALHREEASTEEPAPTMPDG